MKEPIQLFAVNYLERHYSGNHKRENKPKTRKRTKNYSSLAWKYLEVIIIIIIIIINLVEYVDRKKDH